MGLDPRLGALLKVYYSEFIPEEIYRMAVKEDYLVKKFEEILLAMERGIIIRKDVIKEIKKYFNVPEKVGFLLYKINNGILEIYGLRRVTPRESFEIPYKNPSEVYISVHSHERVEELSIQDIFTYSSLINCLFGLYVIKSQLLILFVTTRDGYKLKLEEDNAKIIYKPGFIKRS